MRVICSKCQGEVEVIRTTKLSRTNLREIGCRACAERWETIESEQPDTRRYWSQPVTAGNGQSRPVGTGQHGPPPATTSPPASAGGVGGGLSSGSDLSGSDQAPSVPPDQTRARVSARKRKPAEIYYPPEFEREWNVTAKTGSKLKAFDAWEAFGRPAFGVAWAKWAKLDQWRRGFVPHVVTWLNDRRFQQEPVEPVKTAAPVASIEQQRAQAARAEEDRKAKERREAAAARAEMEEAMAQARSAK